LWQISSTCRIRDRDSLRSRASRYGPLTSVTIRFYISGSHMGTVRKQSPKNEVFRGNCDRSPRILTHITRRPTQVGEVASNCFRRPAQRSQSIVRLCCDLRDWSLLRNKASHRFVAGMPNRCYAALMSGCGTTKAFWGERPPQPKSYIEADPQKETNS